MATRIKKIVESNMAAIFYFVYSEPLLKWYCHIFNHCWFVSLSVCNEIYCIQLEVHNVSKVNPDFFFSEFYSIYEKKQSNMASRMRFFVFLEIYFYFFALSQPESKFLCYTNFHCESYVWQSSFLSYITLPYHLDATIFTHTNRLTKCFGLL